MWMMCPYSPHWIGVKAFQSASSVFSGLPEQRPEPRGIVLLWRIKIPHNLPCHHTPLGVKSVLVIFYGSQSVSSDFENKKPLNLKHWIFMHWSNVSGRYASEYNSSNFQTNDVHHYFSMLKNIIFNVRKLDMQNADAKLNVKNSIEVFSTSPNPTCQFQLQNEMYEIQC